MEARDEDGVRFLLRRGGSIVGRSFLESIRPRGGEGVANARGGSVEVQSMIDMLTLAEEKIMNDTMNDVKKMRGSFTSISRFHQSLRVMTSCE